MLLIGSCVRVISVDLQIFRGIKGVIMGTLLSHNDQSGDNVFLKALKYPSPKDSRKVNPRPEAIENERIIQSGLVSLENVSINGNKRADLQVGVLKRNFNPSW